MLSLAVLFPARFAGATTIAQADTDETNERRVLLLTDKPADPFVDRLRGEIAGLGLAVIVRSQSGALEDEARATGAVAAIRVLPSHKGVEVWMADETSGRSLLRQLIVDERPGGPDQGLITLQTAELLRTSLFPKVTPAATPPPSPPEPVTTTPTPERPRESELGVQAGLGTLHAFGGGGTPVQGWLSLRYSWCPRLGLALNATFPIIDGTVSGAEGSARVGAYFAGLELVTRSKTDSGFYADAGLAASAGRIVGRGDNARPPLLEKSSAATVGAAYLRVGTGFSGSFYAVGLTGLVGSTFERVTIHFADNDAGHWGYPFVAAFVTVELDWR